jgi:uroporphyrinogen decarboxylase
MRQAGRYMAAFREYSDKYPFRMRSETPEIAIELSLQPWRAFRPDGVIFFSDILTPLPALGIEFDVIKGKGPVIAEPLRSMDALRALRTLDDPSSSLAFTGETLAALRREVDGQGTLLGFVGTPWTLAAYAMEGKADRDCKQTKVSGGGARWGKGATAADKCSRRGSRRIYSARTFVAAGNQRWHGLPFFSPSHPCP